MNGLRRSIVAPARWMAAATLLGACSFMAPDEREYSGGLRDAGAIDSPGNRDAHIPVATKRPGASSGGASAGAGSDSGSGGGGAVATGVGGTSSGIGPFPGTNSRGDASAADGAVAPPFPDAGVPAVPPDGGECPANRLLCANGCADTTSDPANCGGCTVSCSAASATGSCSASQCARACMAGYADCNHDLMLGASGSGCETHIASDAANCGACAAPCAGQSADAVFCSSSLCKRYALAVVAGTAGPVHGGDGGLPFSMPCAANEVVVGLRGVVGSDSVYGIGANCARIDIHPNGTSYTLSVVPTSTLPVVGGYPSGETEQTEFAISCPASTVVTAVSGATWPPWGDARVCVKQLTLKCSAISVDSTRKITLGPSSSNIAAGKQDVTSTAFAADTCAGVGVVKGFTGRNGTQVDALSVQCGILSLATQTQKKTDKGWLSEVVETVLVKD